MEPRLAMNEGCSEPRNPVTTQCQSVSNPTPYSFTFSQCQSDNNINNVILIVTRNTRPSHQPYTGLKIIIKHSAGLVSESVLVNQYR